MRQIRTKKWIRRYVALGFAVTPIFIEVSSAQAPASPQCVGTVFVDPANQFRISINFEWKDSLGLLDNVTARAARTQHRALLLNFHIKNISDRPLAWSPINPYSVI